MKRGEIWIVAAPSDHAGKPRPAIIVQDDHFETDSLTICPLTSDPTSGPLLRILVEPTEANGLRVTLLLMADKLTTIAKAKLGRRLGRLDDETMLRLNRAMLVFLGFAG